MGLGHRALQLPSRQAQPARAAPHLPEGAALWHRYSRSEVNALANFTFLTQDTNLVVSDRARADYLQEFAKRHPGAIESHRIPADPALWRVENYAAFLAARRELLARAANQFLDGLLGGTVPEPVAAPSVLERDVATVPGGVAGAEEEALLIACNEWVVEWSLPEGEFRHELTDPGTGEPVAVLDLAWPEGLQPGLSEPVALLLDEPVETQESANRAGYRFFTDIETFRGYVTREVLAATEDERAA